MDREDDKTQTHFVLSKGTMVSHYRIIEEIGCGGKGVVYKAKDTKLKRTVALKFFMPQVLSSKEEKTRFVQEVQAVSALDHPNIAKIYETGETEGKCFVSMVYLEGKSLKEIIKNKRISVRAALEIAIKIGEGLAAAHKIEITHGNMKSENIMLTKEGGIKIMNFGLPTFKAGPGLNKTGATSDTVQYLSPEQAQDSRLDRRTDIFSFGVVLYEMITGQLPFKGEDETSIVHSIIKEDPEPLARYKREAPEQLQKIIDKLLQKDAKLRYQYMDEILGDLKRLKHELISKRPLVFKKVRPRYKKALIAALIICFIIAVTLLVILSKYLLKPILEKRGSVPSTSPIGTMCFGVVDSGDPTEFKNRFSNSVRLDNEAMDSIKIT
jgi:serine/threonine protein kinase